MAINLASTSRVGMKCPPYKLTRSEVLAFFPGMGKGTVVLKHVVVKDVIRHYYQ
jgi:hypothetical protein